MESREARGSVVIWYKICWIFLEQFREKLLEKLAHFEKFQSSGKEDVRKGWRNVDGGHPRASRKPCSLDQDYGFDFGFLHRKHIITDGFRTGIQVVTGRQHNGQHLVWNHIHYKSCVVVAGKPQVRSTRGTKWQWRHMDHDRNKVRCNQKTDINHAFWR